MVAQPMGTGAQLAPMRVSGVNTNIADDCIHSLICEDKEPPRSGCAQTLPQTPIGLHELVLFP
jgi:hypothetical protein